MLLFQPCQRSAPVPAPVGGKWVFYAFLLLGIVAGCGKPPGTIFPPPQREIVWPDNPKEPARIRYVGQLHASSDLKPGVSFTQQFGRALFGRPEVHTMLSPYALCTDRRGRLFVADSNAQLVHVFDLHTRRYTQWRPTGAETRFSQPVGIAYDPAGRLYVSDSVAACIYVFDDSGWFLGTIGEQVLQRPAGLAVHPTTRRIAVADVAAHQVLILDPRGEVIRRLGHRGPAPGEFNFPTNVAIDSTGRLYVSDSLNFRVQQFNPDLTFARTIGHQGSAPGSFSRPKGLAIDSDDQLYVIDAHFEGVQIFSPDGELLLNFGDEGRNAGQFWLPAGIFIDASDRIWIADSYNRRVQVFDYLPEGQ